LILSRYHHPGLECQRPFPGGWGGVFISRSQKQEEPRQKLMIRNPAHSHSALIAAYNLQYAGAATI